MHAVAVPRTATSPTQLLDVAEQLIQTKGYNGFSYADVSAQVGLHKATIHHYFATKSQLGLALVARYRAEFAAALDEIEREVNSPDERLRRYVALYGAALADGGRMCLCGMLAAEVATLPDELRTEVRLFFTEQLAWVAAVLGVRAGAPGDEALMDDADALLAGLEGALLIARVDGGSARFERLAQALLTSLPGAS